MCITDAWILVPARPLLFVLAETNDLTDLWLVPNQILSQGFGMDYEKQQSHVWPMVLYKLISDVTQPSVWVPGSNQSL